MTFDQAVEVILHHEGGYVNHPRDPGGETNFGISKKAFPLVDIKNMTKDQAKIIYRKFYWDETGCDSLPAMLRLLVFDCAVNQGAGVAVGLLQAAVGAKVDGILGPNTLEKIAAHKPIKIVEKYAAMRHLRYTQTKGFQDFGAGWTRRLLDVAIKSLGALDG